MARKHLDAVRRVAGRITAAHAHLGDAMLAAKDSGETIDDIRAAAGLGRTQTYELINQAKARQARAREPGA